MYSYQKMREGFAICAGIAMFFGMFFQDYERFMWAALVCAVLCEAYAIDE